jgi:hypothetical protein
MIFHALNGWLCFQQHQGVRRVCLIYRDQVEFRRGNTAQHLCELTHIIKTLLFGCISVGTRNRFVDTGITIILECCHSFQAPGWQLGENFSLQIRQFRASDGHVMFRSQPFSNARARAKAANTSAQLSFRHFGSLICHRVKVTTHWSMATSSSHRALFAFVSTRHVVPTTSIERDHCLQHLAQSLGIQGLEGKT